MSPFLRSFRILQFLTLAMWSFGVGAQLFKERLDDKEWKEQEFKLPPYPKSENLIAAQITGTTGFVFFVDGTSIDIGEDGVVRFVVVARSAAGAENVSFEGIRCGTRERKLYAVGRANGTWFAPSASEWVSFQGARINSYHDSFARQYFCNERTPVLNSAKANELLRKK